MKVQLVVLLGVFVSCLATGTDVLDGSGADDEVVDVAARLTITDDAVVEGSGDEEEAGDSSISSYNVVCSALELTCWCVYLDNTEVPDTRVYAREIDCSAFRDKLPPTELKSTPKTVTSPSTDTTLPSRTKAGQPHDIIEATAAVEPFDDITYEEEPGKTDDPANDIEENDINFNMDIPLKSGSVLDIDGKDIADMDNKVPVYNDVETSKDIDEAQEEIDNKISGAQGVKLAASRDQSVEKVMVPHPGIMAALIGAGVVLLLCAILIILFIIYRVRKKDEGSYPLGDEKPLKNYAYSKAPSREFFA